MDNLDILLNDLKDSVANTVIPSYQNNYQTSEKVFDKELQVGIHLKNHGNISNPIFHESNNSLNNSHSLNNNYNDQTNVSNNNYNDQTNVSNNNYNDQMNVSNNNYNDQMNVSNNNYNDITNVSNNNNNPMHTSNNNSMHTSILSTNLSELDSLLQELSSANFHGEVNRRSSGTSSNQNTLPKQDNALELVPPKETDNESSELDDLMSSLSCLQPDDTKVETSYQSNNPTYSSNANHYDLTPYNESELQSDDLNCYDNIGSIIQQQQHQQDNDSGNLNAMMESLNKDLTMQGVQVTSRGHCAACGKLIVGQVITALGQLWHPEHFVCAKCKGEIGSENFFERDNVPYCETDYHLLFSPKCAHCDAPILNRCVTALDRTWHPEHFCCYTCGKELGNEAFHEKDGRIFCQFDYFQHFAPKCGTCGEAISDDFLTALNQQWHPQCFVCFECHKPFGAASFFEHGGYPYCSLHYHAKKGSLCADCQQPISGRCITAMSLKFHPDHFRCTYCQKPLTKGTFKEENNKPYCHRCFMSFS